MLPQQSYAHMLKTWECQPQYSGLGRSEQIQKRQNNGGDNKHVMAQVLVCYVLQTRAHLILTITQWDKLYYVHFMYFLIFGYLGVSEFHGVMWEFPCRAWIL